jgi:hypothetical protein
MFLSHQALDKHVSQELSKFTRFNAPDLGSASADAEYWVNNFILNAILRVDIKEEAKPFVFAIIRRAQMAIDEYENGCREAQDYISGKRDRVSVYFRSLNRFELVVQLLYQAYEYVMKVTGQPLYQKGDGSPVQRLNRIYNASKHLEASSIPSGHIHAVWLSNAGINISNATLTWDELAALVMDIGGMAKSLSSSPEPNVEGE